MENSMVVLLSYACMHTHFQVEYICLACMYTYEWYVYVGITFMTDVFGSIYIHQLSSCNFPQNIFIAIELGGW